MADVPPNDDHVVIRPACAAYGNPASLVELVPPRERPSAWDEWSPGLQEAFSEHHSPTSWRFIYEGIEAGNGTGDDIDSEQAAAYRAAFDEPLRYETVRQADLYDDAGFCEECDVPYCAKHWNVSRGGFGHCPRGHGKSLDPHWSPRDYD